MAGAHRKVSAATTPGFASLVSEPGSPLTRSEKLVRDPWLDRLDRLEAKLDARFDEVRELLQELFVNSRAGEFAAEDREEEAAVEEEEEEEIATDDLEKEEDDGSAAAIVEEEEIEEEEKEVEGGSTNTHLEQQQQMEAIFGADLGPFQAISQLMSAAIDQSSQAESFFNLSRERHPDSFAHLLRPYPLLEIRAKESKEEKLVFFAFLQLTQQCPPGVCKNALKMLGLQFAHEMGMTMEVGDDEMLLPLPRPPPEPPPEPPPRA